MLGSGVPQSPVLWFQKASAFGGLTGGLGLAGVRRFGRVASYGTSTAARGMPPCLCIFDAAQEAEQAATLMLRASWLDDDVCQEWSPSCSRWRPVRSSDGERMVHRGYGTMVLRTPSQGNPAHGTGWGQGPHACVIPIVSKCWVMTVLMRSPRGRHGRMRGECCGPNNIRPASALRPSNTAWCVVDRRHSSDHMQR